MKHIFSPPYALQASWKLYCYGSIMWIKNWKMLLISLSHPNWVFFLPAPNLAINKAATQSSTLWRYEPGLAVDSNLTSCSFTPRTTEQRWWQVHLGETYPVQSVAITIMPGTYQSFTVFVIGGGNIQRDLMVHCSTYRWNCLLLHFQEKMRGKEPTLSSATHLMGSLNLSLLLCHAKTLLWKDTKYVKLGINLNIYVYMILFLLIFFSTFP